MGRRAKKAPVQTKKRHTLAKRFKCPFCTVEDVVECKMDQRKGIGSLACRLCGASFQMPVHHLHEPIDVFSEWLDECEAVKSGGGAGGGDGGGAAGTTGGGGMVGSRGTAIGGVGMYDDSDDELPEASGLHAAAAPAPAAPEPSAVAAAPAASALPAAGGGAEKASFSTLGLDDSDSD